MKIITFQAQFGFVESAAQRDSYFVLTAGARFLPSTIQRIRTEGTAHYSVDQGNRRLQVHAPAQNKGLWVLQGNIEVFDDKHFIMRLRPWNYYGAPCDSIPNYGFRNVNFVVIHSLPAPPITRSHLRYPEDFAIGGEGPDFSPNLEVEATYSLINDRGDFEITNKRIIPYGEYDQCPSNSLHDNPHQHTPATFYFFECTHHRIRSSCTREKRFAEQELTSHQMMYRCSGNAQGISSFYIRPDAFITPKIMDDASIGTETQKEVSQACLPLRPWPPYLR